MTKFEQKIIKAKKIFKLKDTDKRLNSRIGRVVKSQLLRNNNYDVTLIQKRCYDLFYMLEDIKKTYTNLTPCKLYKIFRLCLWGLDELLFFNDTIGTSKDYSYRKIIKFTKKASIYIIDFDPKKIRIPKNPNDTYNEIYFELLNEYKIKKNDTLNLLSCVYDRNKKAKVPKRTIEELKVLKDTFHRIIIGGGKEKGLSKEEINNEIKEIDTHFKDYL